MDCCTAVPSCILPELVISEADSPLLRCSMQLLSPECGMPAFSFVGVFRYELCLQIGQSTHFGKEFES